MDHNQAARFWAKVDRGKDAREDQGEGEVAAACWRWLGAKHQKGYGLVKLNGRLHVAHRVAWQLERGAEPAGTVRPDGSLMQAKLSALAGGPFSDWRIPGILLATLVGGGFVGTGLWQWRGGWHARELSLLAGLGLVAFEAAELTWIGFQPLEAVFSGVGLAVIALAWRLPQVVTGVS